MGKTSLYCVLRYSENSLRLRLKQCQRCNEFYKGSKYSKYCDDCKKRISPHE